MKKLLQQMDLQDVLLFAGIALLIGGIAAIYRPAGAIAAGCMAVFAALLIERSKASATKKDVK